VQLAQIGEAPTARALYRFHRDVGDAMEAVVLVSLADGAGAGGERVTREGWMRQVAYMNSLIVRLRGQGGIVHAPRLLTGRDIMSEFGLAEGPRIGTLLEAVNEAQAAGEVHDRESALTYVRARLA
jgi:poly(A) polymerase